MKSPLSLSVQSKLVAAFTLLTLMAIVLVSAIGYFSARKSLRTAAENQLIGLQRSKVGLIRTMLTSTRNEILTFSATDVAATAATEMLAAYRQLDTVPITPAMQEAVRGFYATDFEPQLARLTAATPAAGSLLPTTPAGWYVHYHYLAMGERPTGRDANCRPRPTAALLPQRSPGSSACSDPRSTASGSRTSSSSIR